MLSLRLQFISIMFNPVIFGFCFWLNGPPRAAWGISGLAKTIAGQLGKMKPHQNRQSSTV